MSPIQRGEIAPIMMSILFASIASGAFAGSGTDAASQTHPLRVADATLLTGRSITATVGGVQLSAYVAQSSGQGPFPAVVMIHEWWGLNTQIKQTADALAKEGYLVVAPDLYKGNVATDSKTAAAYMNALNRNDAIATLKAAYQWITEQPATKGKKIGSVGWCMGGGYSLQLGLAEPVDAVVIYYGLLETDPSILRRLKGPVLGIFANRDGWINPEMVNGFEQGLNAAPIAHQIYRYDADHAFANPSGPNYKSEMAADAWGKMVAFFGKHLK